MPIPGSPPEAKIISLTGDLGSGKSTVSEMLEKRWGVKRYYTGAVLREIAAKRGVDILQANHMADTDPSIDQEIDSVYKSLAHSHEDLIVDARMGWNFLPQSFKIKLTVCPMIAAERIYHDKTRRAEKVDAPAEILGSLLARKASEVERFKKTYGVNLEEDANYDLVIDTANVSPEDVVNLIDRLSPLFFSGEHIEHHWICPKSLYPSARAQVTASGLELPADEFDKAPVQVVDYNRLYLIIDGHTRTSKALVAGLPMLPARSFKLWEDIPGKNLTGLEFYRQHLNSENIHEWETIHDFKYIMLPDRP